VYKGIPKGSPACSTAVRGCVLLPADIHHSGLPVNEATVCRYHFGKGKWQIDPSACEMLEVDNLFG
jgi:hypothetical protein